MLDEAVFSEAKIYLVQGTVESRPDAVALDLAASASRKFFGPEGKVYFLSCISPEACLKNASEVLGVPLKVLFSPPWSSDPISSLISLLTSNYRASVASDLLSLPQKVLLSLLRKHLKEAGTAEKELRTMEAAFRFAEGEKMQKLPEEDGENEIYCLYKLLSAARGSKKPLILLSSEENLRLAEPFADVILRTEHRPRGENSIDLIMYLSKTPRLSFKAFRYSFGPQGVQFETLFGIT